MIKYTLAAVTFATLTGCNNSSSIALTDSSLNNDAAPSVEAPPQPCATARRLRYISIARPCVQRGKR